MVQENNLVNSIVLNGEDNEKVKLNNLTVSKGLVKEDKINRQRIDNKNNGIRKENVTVYIRDKDKIFINEKVDDI